MCLKHKLCPAARKMNIVPGLHSTLISVPKLADAGYTTVFTKKGAEIYDDYTTQITASKPPVLDAERCDHTGLWKLTLDDINGAQHKCPPATDTINDSYTLLNASVSYLYNDWELNVFGTNLTDEEYYSSLVRKCIWSRCMGGTYNIW